MVKFLLNNQAEYGEFECDESYFGPRRIRGKRGRGAAGKTPVFGLLKRGGKVYVEIVKNSSKGELLPIIEGKILEGSTIHTDGWRAYDGLLLNGYDHKGQFKAAGPLQLQASHIDNQGVILGEGHTTVTSQTDIINQATLLGGESLTVTAGDTLENKDWIATEGSLTLAARAVANTGSIESQQHKTTLKIAENLNNQGTLYAKTALSVTAQGPLHNTQQIITEGTLTLSAQNITHQAGHIAGRGDVSITTQTDLASNAEILSEQALYLQVQGNLNNQQQITAQGPLQLTAQNLENAGTLESKTQAVALQVKGTFQNQGTVFGKTALLMDIAQQAQNTGKLMSHGALSLTAHDLINDQGDIAGQDHAKLTLQTDLINTGEIFDVGHLTVTVGRQVDNQALLAAGKNLTLTAQALSNTGDLQGNEGAVNLQVQHQLDNQKTIASGQDIHLVAGTTLHNQGTLSAERRMQLQAQEATNTGEISGGALDTTIEIQENFYNKQTLNNNTHLFAVTVGGAMKQVGAQVGSKTTGQADLDVKGKTVKEDVYSDYTENNFGLNGRLGARETGGPKSAINREPVYGKFDYGTRQVIGQATCDGETRTIAATGTQLSVDTEALKAAAKPQGTVNEIVRDTQAVYSAGEGIVNAFAANTKDEKGKRALGARGVVAGLRFSCEDAAGLHDTAQDEKATEVTNNATEASAATLQATLEQESKKVQTRDGIAPEKQADLLLYQGDDDRFKDSPLKGCAAAYDQDHTKTYVNTQGTDVSRGGDLMGSVYHEAQRRTNASSDFLSGLSEQQQTNLSKLRGQQASRTWERVSGASRTSRPEANSAFNQRNQEAIQQNHKEVAAHGVVKPREYNFDCKTGQFSYVSEEGGNQRHPINLGYTDEEGNFVPLQQEVVEGDTNISVRFKETDKETLSSFIIPGESEDKDIRGFYLEPGGPATVVSNQNKRIPAGIYNYMRHFGEDFKDVPKLYNDRVSTDRGILEHGGNNREETEGCLLPGKSWKENEILVYQGKVVRDEDGNPVRGIVVEQSQPKLREIQNYLNTKGYENVQQYIFDFLPADQERVAAASPVDSFWDDSD